MIYLAPLCLTAWPSLTTPVGRAETSTWDELLTWIRHPKSADSKASLPGFSLARFRDDQRADANVLEVSAIVLDDDKSGLSVEDVARGLESLGRAGVVFSTYSATAAHPRTRTILLTSRPMTRDEHARVWTAVRDTVRDAVGLIPDEQAKDASRFWYVPALPPTETFTYAELAGEPLDIDAILAQTPAVTTAPARADDADEDVTDPDERAYRRDLYASYLKTTPKVRSAANRGRGDVHLYEVVQYGAYDLALPTEDVLELVREHYDPRNDRQWGDELEERVYHKARTAKTASTRARLEPPPRELAHVFTLEPPPPQAPVVVPPPKKYLTASERALRIGGRDVKRILTGFPTLDTATRGGILGRKVAIFGGAPGAGKTAAMIRIAYECLTENHVAAGILAADEDVDALLIRLGQLHGLSRDALENGDADARAKLAEWFESVPLLVADGDEDDATIEAVSTELKRIAPDGGALFIDSIQTARSAEPLERGSDLRSRINANVRALKRAAKLDGHTVFASSELSKAAYRNASQAENVNALSAFKESGDIEYGVAVAVVLTSRPGTHALIDATVVKNRLGPGKPEFILCLDHETADVHELTSADAPIADPLYDLKERVKAMITRAAGNGVSRKLIYETIGGNKQRLLQAIASLVDHHILIDASDGIRFPLPGEEGFMEPSGSTPLYRG